MLNRVSQSHEWRRAVVVAAALLLGACAADETEAPDVADRVAFRIVPSTVVAGETFTPEVQVVLLRADGSVATGVSADVALSARSATGPDTLRGTTVVEATAGVATFPGLSLVRAGGGVRLFAESPGLTGAESAPITIQPGRATALVFVAQPDSGVAGAPLATVRVEARDVGGNRATGTAGPVTLTLATGPAGATLAGTVTTDMVAGQAVFTGVALPRAGSGYTLQASLVGSAATAAISRTFAVRAGAASQLAFLVEPSTAVAGQAIVPAPQVVVLDANGNRVNCATPDVTLSVALAPATFTLGGTLTSTAVAGVATFADVRPGQAAGTVRLTAAAPGLQSATSVIFTVGTAVLGAP